MPCATSACLWHTALRAVPAALEACSGSDIVRSAAARKGRVLVSLPGILLPSSAGAIGHISGLNSGRPVLELPASGGGVLRLRGTLVRPASTVLSLSCDGSKRTVTCLDAFQAMIAFTGAELGPAAAGAEEATESAAGGAEAPALASAAGPRVPPACSAPGGHIGCGRPFSGTEAAATAGVEASALAAPSSPGSTEPGDDDGADAGVDGERRRAGADAAARRGAALGGRNRAATGDRGAAVEWRCAPAEPDAEGEPGDAEDCNSGETAGATDTPSSRPHRAAKRPRSSSSSSSSAGPGTERLFEVLSKRFESAVPLRAQAKRQPHQDAERDLHSTNVDRHAPEQE